MWKRETPAGLSGNPPNAEAGREPSTAQDPEASSQLSRRKHCPNPACSRFHFRESQRRCHACNAELEWRLEKIAIDPKSAESGERSSEPSQPQRQDVLAATLRRMQTEATYGLGKGPLNRRTAWSLLGLVVALALIPFALGLLPKAQSKDSASRAATGITATGEVQPTPEPASAHTGPVTVQSLAETLRTTKLRFSGKIGGMGGPTWMQVALHLEETATPTLVAVAHARGKRYEKRLPIGGLRTPLVLDLGHVRLKLVGDQSERLRLDALPLHSGSLRRDP